MSHESRVSTIHLNLWYLGQYFCYRPIIVGQIINVAGLCGHLFGDDKCCLMLVRTCISFVLQNHFCVCKDLVNSFLLVKSLKIHD